MSEKHFFALYSTNCLKCSLLVEGGKKEFIPCSYKKGNTECPASEVRMVVVGKAQVYASKVLAARKKQDLAREARLLEYVARQSKGFQSKFHDALNNA